jgi:hypothetical protein
MIHWGFMHEEMVTLKEVGQTSWKLIWGLGLAITNVESSI